MIDLTSTFSVSFLMLSLAIAAVTNVIKSLVRARFPKLYASNWYNPATVMAIPAMLGAVACSLMTDFPYVDGYNGFGYRLLTGLAAGAASSYVFDFIKRALKAKRDSE